MFAFYNLVLEKKDQKRFWPTCFVDCKYDEENKNKWKILSNKAVYADCEQLQV
jgi:hypothetical protein